MTESLPDQNRIWALMQKNAAVQQRIREKLTILDGALQRNLQHQRDLLLLMHAAPALPSPAPTAAQHPPNDNDEEAVRSAAPRVPHELRAKFTPVTEWCSRRIPGTRFFPPYIVHPNRSEAAEPEPPPNKHAREIMASSRELVVRRHLHTPSLQRPWVEVRSKKLVSAIADAMRNVDVLSSALLEASPPQTLDPTRRRSSRRKKTSTTAAEAEPERPAKRFRHRNVRIPLVFKDFAREKYVDEVMGATLAQLLPLTVKHGDPMSVLSQETWKAVANECGRIDLECQWHWRHFLRPLMLGQVPTAAVYDQANEQYRKAVYEAARTIKWTKEESQRLNELYEQFGTDWVVIATFFPGRIGDQCGLQYRTNYPHIRRSKWIKEEDELLIEAYQHEVSKSDAGTVSSSAVASWLPGRNERQCYDRYNRVNPEVTRQAFTVDEKRLLIDVMRQRYGIDFGVPDAWILGPKSYDHIFQTSCPVSAIFGTQFGGPEPPNPAESVRPQTGDLSQTVSWATISQEHFSGHAAEQVRYAWLSIVRSHSRVREKLGLF